MRRHFTISAYHPVRLAAPYQLAVNDRPHRQIVDDTKITRTRHNGFVFTASPAQWPYRLYLRRQQGCQYSRCLYFHYHLSQL